MGFQEVLSLMLVAAALAHVIWRLVRFWRLAKQQDSGSCSHCLTGCSASEPSRRTLVQLEARRR